MSNRPKMIYKYGGFNRYSLLNLKSQALFFNSPMNLNDPYDGSLLVSPHFPDREGVERIRNHYANDPSVPPHLRNEFAKLTDEAVTDLVVRKANEVLFLKSQEYQKTMGVTCFSEINDNLLMWGHYGDKYRGFCLGFRTDVHPFEKIRQIHYSAELPKVDIVDIIINKNFDDALDSMFYTKSKSWEYEQEWRGVHSQSGTQYVYEKEALEGVYFGPNIEDQALEIICLIVRGQNPNVRFYKGQKSDTQFKVEFVPFEYTSFVERGKASE